MEQQQYKFCFICGKALECTEHKEEREKIDNEHQKQYPLSKNQTEEKCDYAIMIAEKGKFKLIVFTNHPVHGLAVKVKEMNKLLNLELTIKTNIDEWTIKLEDFVNKYFYIN